MVPLLLVIGGFVALGVGAGLILSFGEALRIGRLIAGTRTVPIADLPGIASAGRAAYVRVDGRIDSDDEFEDYAHRPLVFRRTTVQVRDRSPVGARWRTVDEGREAVPFRIGDALGEVAIDPDDLGPGLVVISRESVGIAADAPDRVPTGTPSDTPVRIRIDQVSSIEHAIVLGVPTLVPGALALRPGLGRPLILTTLEPPEAMRVLAAGRQWRIQAAVALLVAGGAALALGVVTAILGVGR